MVGQDSGPERDAGNELAAELAKDLRPEDDFVIIVGAKCYGQARQDIDLLIFGDFHPPLAVAGRYLGRKFPGKAVFLDSFVLALEVKDHRPGDIRFIGNQVEVRYAGNWSNVTHAVFQQRFSVKNFLMTHHRESPFILSAIWLRNVERRDLPEAPNDILIGNPTASDIWSLVVRLSSGRAPAADAGTLDRIV